MKYMGIILLVIVGPQLWAQDVFNGPNSTVNWIVGNAQTSPHTTSLYGNPAAPAMQKQASLQLHAANRFTQQALFDGQLQYIHASSLGAFSAGLRYFGDQIFNEQLFSFGYARAIGAKVNAGVAAHFYTRNIEKYESHNHYYVSLGAVTSVTSNLLVSFALTQGVGTYAESFEEQTNRIQAGAMYQFQAGAELMVAMQKESQRKASLQVGLIIPVHKKLKTMLGVDTATSSFGFGLRLPVDRFSIDVGAKIHTALGISPALGATYFIGKNNA